MSRRRDDLRALFAGEPAPETKALVPAVVRPVTGIASPTAAPSPPPVVVPRSGSGALKAMGLELDGMKLAAEEASALREKLSGGELVVELDTALVDAAFVRDRMDEQRDADSALEASIAEHGQQVPILVRPHPAKPGYYEAVYGHRRLSAIRRLGKPVRAVVKVMSDDELVIAQGQENNARLDLSFIERARFAAVLEERGFSRHTIMASLDVHKADVARYIAVIETINNRLIERIGPAPKTGRPRWMKLGELLGGKCVPESVETLLSSGAFAAKDSDQRFVAVITALTAKSAPAADASWRSVDGRLEVTRRRGTTSGQLQFGGADSVAFTAFLQSRLDQLHAEFSQQLPGPGRLESRSP
jgi:ParB family transcriptional regulator, chromosome partitioning protein